MGTDHDLMMSELKTVVCPQSFSPETADYRIRTVTQVLENIAFRSDISSDTVVLTDFCKLLTTSLRDGCDVMDVIGRRLRAQAAE